MSLPPGFLDELRTRTSLAQVVGRKVMWDARKSNQGKGDMWAPCPFHQEKSASFHVDDRKGYYYCFGCHAKGDAISFVRETENVDFMEAIEILAREAGMQMPARDPQAAQRADRRTELAQVMEQAVQFYRLQLRTAAGADARDYLARRGLSEAAQDRWEIGFAPDGWQALHGHLSGKGVPDDLILGAGLVKASDKGKRPYDTFRNRIIFPIRDPRGRAIAFGGRAMDPSDSAKYLNSPETELFDKGRSLYNHGPAREAAGKGQPLVVAEGYMDVIALSEAGFGATVAPLGTAVTDDQLRMLWRIHPEPVVALDGDKAGIGAALRLMDLALPLLEAGQGLRFAIMPEGLDPDDVIKTQGVDAMRKIVEGAQPMVNLLWRRATEGKVLDSPERRAMLDKELRAAIRRIADPSIRSHYTEAIRELRSELFGANRRGAPQSAPRSAFVPGARRGGFGQGGFGQDGFGRGGWKGPPLPSLPETRSSLLATAAGPGAEEHLREAMILAICVIHPVCAAEFESQLEKVEMRGAGHDRLRLAVLRHCHDPASVTQTDAFRQKILSDAGEILEKLMALGHVQIAPPVRNAEDTDLARMCLAEELAKLEARRGAKTEIEDAMEDLSGLADEGVTWRLSQAAKARHRADKTNLDDASDGEDRVAMSRHLQNLIDGEVWVKKKG